MKISLLSWKKNLQLSFVLLMGVIILTPAVQAAWRVNAWSLYFSRTAQLEKIGTGTESFAKIPPPTHQRAPLWLARQVLKDGKSLEAEVILKPLAEEGNQDALIIMGDALAAAGDFPGAVQVWQQAGIYSVLNQAALKAQENGLSENAILAGRAAWELEPEEGALSLATFLNDSENLEGAKDLLIKMLKEYPNSLQRQDWLLWLADLSRTQKEWQVAESFYRQILDENPQSIPALIGQGWMYYERGDGLDAALKVFQLAAAQSPENGQVYLAMGKVLSREGLYQEAGPWFANAVKINPDNRWWGLAQINNLRAAGNLTNAILLYKEAIQRYPDWSQVYYELAWAYKLNNQLDLAIEAIEQAINFEKLDKFIYYWRAGIIYEQADKPEFARKAYEKAIEINPQDTLANIALKRLQVNE